MTGGPLTHDAETAAAIIGCSARWLVEKARAGAIPSVQFGRTPRRFTDEHIAEIVARHTQQQGPRRRTSGATAEPRFPSRRRRAA